MNNPELHLIHRFIKNHYSFYESLGGEFSARAEDSIEYYDSDFSKTRTSILTLSKKLLLDARRKNLVIEEYVGFPRLLVVALISVLIPRIRYTLCLHNINSWLIISYPISLRKTLSFLAKSIIIKRASSIIVVSNSLADYASNMIGSSKMKVVPFRTSQSPIRQNSKPKTIYVIPGNVEEDKRNYIQVLEAFQIAKQRTTNISLILLGTLNYNKISAELASKINLLRSEYTEDFKVYEEFVPISEFDSVLDSAACLICNVVQFHRTTGSFEVYGMTKQTGIAVLAESLNKKLLAPHYLLGFGSNQITYTSSQDLANKICEQATH